MPFEHEAVSDRRGQREEESRTRQGEEQGGRNSGTNQVPAKKLRRKQLQAVHKEAHKRSGTLHQGMLGMVPNTYEL